MRFAEHLDQPVMLFHISTEEGAAAVQATQRRGARVWAETCPHYLLMTDEVLNQPGLQGQNSCARRRSAMRRIRLRFGTRLTLAR